MATGASAGLLISLLLVNWDLLSLPLLYLSAYFEQHRQEYYDLLLAVSQRGAWREWLAFFLAGVEEQARDANARAKKLQDLQLQWRADMQKARVSGLVIGVVDALFRTPAISASDIIAQFGVSHQAAMQALRRLEEIGVVSESSGKQRGRIYLATEIVRAVE